MAVKLTIPYETLVELVEQLDPAQQRDLLQHLQGRLLTVDEKMALLRSVYVDMPMLEEPSVRREDWYGDDGR